MTDTHTEATMDRAGFLGRLLAIPAAMVGRNTRVDQASMLAKVDEVDAVMDRVERKPINVTTVIEVGDFDVDRCTQFSMRCINQLADCYGVDVAVLLGDER